MIIAMYFLMVSGLFYRQFVNRVGTHQVLVLDDKRLVATPVLLVQLRHEALAVGDGELRHREHRALAFLSRHEGDVVLRAERQDDLLLHGGTFRHFLIDYFPCDVVHVERHVALVLDLRVEV